MKASIGSTDAYEQDRRLRGLVVACSALKKLYRDVLRGGRPVLTNNQELDTATSSGNALPGELHPHEPLHSPLIFPTFFVHLTGSYDTLYERMGNRKGHFMKANMLDSQIRALEPPSDEEKSNDVVHIDCDTIVDTEAQVEFALSAMAERGVARR